MNFQALQNSVEYAYAETRRELPMGKTYYEMYDEDMAEVQRLIRQHQTEPLSDLEKGDVIRAMKSWLFTGTAVGNSLKLSLSQMKSREKHMELSGITTISFQRRMDWARELEVALQFERELQSKKTRQVTARKAYQQQYDAHNPHEAYRRANPID